MISFRYRSTSYYLLPSDKGDGLLAFDAGWPCSLREYARSMKPTGYRFERITWAIVSHFHLDHAGLVRDFQDAGIACILFENQGEGIDDMEAVIAPKYREYRPILKDRFERIATSESRAFLGSLGIRGEVLATPGHSRDSVTLVADGGDALIGDLYPPGQVMPDDAVALGSWERIRELGASRAWPSHAPAWDLGFREGLG